MARIEIYIDGIKADLPEKDLNLNLTFALKDRNGIAINSGSRSEYSFDLPSTKQNDNIFSRFHDVGEVTLQRQDLLPAIIIVDGLPFFEGKAQVRSVTTQQDRFYWKGLSYKVSFYGNNVDWVADMRNKFIYELDFGTFTFGRNENYLAYNNNYDNGDSYATGIIKFKNYSGTPQRIDTFKDSTPLLFIKTILDKIFNSIGYTYQSNFFNTNWFKQLVLPIPMNPDKVENAQYGIDYLNVDVRDLGTPIPQVGGGGFTFTQVTTPPLANPFNVLTSQYIVPIDGYYLMSFILEVYNVGATGCGVELTFHLNGAPTTFTIGEAGPLGVPPYFSDQFIRRNILVTFNAGDVLEFFWTGQLGSPVGSSSGNFDFYWQIIGEPLINTSILLNFSYIIDQQWRQLDLIKGLAHLFNLTFETNVALRTVTIEPADNYLLQDYDVPISSIEQGFYNKSFSDLTRNVDLNVKGELFNIDDFERSIQFIYREDSNDPTVEALNQGQNVPMAGAQFNFPVSRLKNGVTDIENPFFSATVLYADPAVKSATSNPVYIPFIWPENFFESPSATIANYKVNPRILIKYKNYLTDNVVYVRALDPAGSGTNVNIEFPQMFMTNFYEFNNEYMSLAFNTITTTNGVQMKGLLERFYLAEMIRRMYGKQMEVYMFWDVLMLNNLTFRDTIQIHGDNYILNEINSFSVVNQRSTKTYLTYDAKGDGTEVNNIQNSIISINIIP